jgi:hypothetical protein
MFLGAVSGTLVALGLVATATGVGTAFYVFALLLLPTLTFVGVVTFERALQSGLEDHGYARRIDRLRSYYFDNAPEITPYLMSVPLHERLHVQGLWEGRFQGFRTVAGMVAVITAVLGGTAAGVVAALLTDDSLWVGGVVGVLVALVGLVAMMRYQRNRWDRAAAAPLFDAEGANV